MFAVIRTGGKQYRVAKDDVIKVEKLDGEAGDKIDLTDVLMVGGEGAATKVGAPVLAGASVKAEIVEQGRSRKVLIFKKKRRQNYRRRAGHRQHETFLKITEIAAG
ncbi:MAG: 50S ribosomal protein L21 [Parvibaculum sp.]